MPDLDRLRASPSWPCPQCDAAGAVLSSPTLGDPEPGDLVICLVCGSVNVITSALGLRQFTVEDLDY